MSDDSGADGAAKRLFAKADDRYEKGSALSVIRAETDATQAKTARLKAERLARAAAEAEAAPAPAAAPKRKRAAASRKT